MFGLWFLYHGGITVSHTYLSSICLVCKQGSHPHLTCIQVASLCLKELFCCFCFGKPDPKDILYFTFLTLLLFKVPIFQCSILWTKCDSDRSLNFLKIEIIRGLFNMRSYIVCKPWNVLQWATPFFQPACLQWDERKEIEREQWEWSCALTSTVKEAEKHSQTINIFSEIAWFLHIKVWKIIKCNHTLTLLLKGKKKKTRAELIIRGGINLKFMFLLTRSVSLCVGIIV